jgi:hypothetical protein
MRQLRTISSVLFLALFAVMNMHSVVPHGHCELSGEAHHSHSHEHEQDQDHEHHHNSQLITSAHDVFSRSNQEEQQKHHHHHGDSEKGIKDFFFFLLSAHAHGIEVSKHIFFVISKDQIKVDKPTLALLYGTPNTASFGIPNQATNLLTQVQEPPGNYRFLQIPSNALRGPPTSA